jgi:hypothetical protein
MCGHPFIDRRSQEDTFAREMLCGIEQVKGGIDAIAMRSSDDRTELQALFVISCSNARKNVYLWKPDWASA